jgi:hypothetical protein
VSGLARTPRTPSSHNLILQRGKESHIQQLSAAKIYEFNLLTNEGGAQD